MCDKTKINCQCDGNCNCGEILPNGKISCDNCGWKAPLAYDTLTGNFACPSCRTESSYSANNNIKPKNKNMNKTFTDGAINQGVVGFATGMDGFLNWKPNTLQSPGESNFVNSPRGNSFGDNISAQNLVGFAIGQSWMPMNPDFSPAGQGRGESSFDENGSEMSEEDKQWANIFYEASDDDSEESGLFEGFGMAARGVFCGKVCKGLGYMRKDDKTAFKKCKNSCQLKPNFKLAKKGKWNYPPAPEGIEPMPPVEKMAADSAKEVAATTSNQGRGQQFRPGDTDFDTPNAPAKSNTMMYVIIGVVVLAIIAAIIIMMRRKSAA